MGSAGTFLSLLAMGLIGIILFVVLITCPGGILCARGWRLGVLGVSCVLVLLILLLLMIGFL